MTIYSTLLGRGYFPKELPPSFSSEEFARFAVTKVGRAIIRDYRPQDGYTECVDYQLALSGGHRRGLAIPHPYSYAKLAQLVARNLSQLLRKAGRSLFAKSRPVYTAATARAIRTLIDPTNTTREKMLARGGSRVLLKADVNQFYPSLYTHAIGWAVNPDLRERPNWRNATFLGKQLDQALMECQGKRSQGLPVGPDISTLLAEIVLCQVDCALDTEAAASYRWFDDYEFGCRSREEAERIWARLETQLKRFNLRLNSSKTMILETASPIYEEWQLALQSASRQQKGIASELLRFFDMAFRFRQAYPEAPVLNYACASLFTIGCPADHHSARIAQSCLSQAVLAEPGISQKAFALLGYWTLNGMALDKPLVSKTVSEMVRSQQHRGLSSDAAWALAFCLRHKVKLIKDAGESLCESLDDCVSLQALDLRSSGLAPGMALGPVKEFVRRADLDGEHWLLAYESVRQGFASVGRSKLQKHKFFGALLKSGVSFYQKSLPDYAEVVHSGGAPDWIVKSWLKLTPDTSKLAVPRMVATEAATFEKAPRTGGDLMMKLISRLADSDQRDDSTETY